MLQPRLKVDDVTVKSVVKGKVSSKWPIIFIDQIESAYFFANVFVIYFIKNFSLKFEAKNDLVKVGV